MTERDADVGIKTRPFPIVLSAPSGAGKTSVANEIFERLPYIRFAVSLTTRARREGEVDGADYRFVDEAEFERARGDGELAEWAVVHGNLYGTPRAEIDRALEDGYHVLLDVDVQGGTSLMRAYPGAVSIFLLPPSHAAMEARLRGRGTDSAEVIDGRMEEALRELESVEQYEYVIVNRELEKTVEVFSSIIHAEERRRVRLDTLGEWLEVHFPRRAAPGISTTEGGIR
ncbi:MAG TPA: guanylate kinase [Gemmatimonadota bacterium]|nr:guanylate kinase [Gemmatimonadota bacterium]